MKMKTNLLRKSILLLLFTSAASTMFSQINQQPYTNNWYVGNTHRGEWIKFRKVWLSAGDYRFTTQAVAGQAEQTVHLELNDEVLTNNIVVPFNSENKFEKVHLGSKKLAEGYYDVKLVFETGNVSCDMIFIRKDDSKATQVLDDDTKYELNFDDGMHIFAIGGHANSTRELQNGTDHGADAVWTDPKGNKYNRSQVLSWNKQSMYNFNHMYTQETTDIYVQEQVEAKVEVIFAHGRGEPDNTVQIADRAYQTGPGGAPCGALKFLVDGIKRNPYARDQVKIAYFADNAPFNLAVQKYLGVEQLVWGNVEHQEFIWNYAIKKFYQTIPRELLYFTEDGKVPMQWWTANSHVSYPSAGYQHKEFMEYMVKKMKEEFDLDVALILSKTFFDRDPRTKDLAWGVQSWFSWSNMGVRSEILEHKGKKFAFALNGGRKPMKDLVLNDWNPQTNKGTWLATDAHVVANYTDGTPKMRAVYEDGHAQGAEWLVLEAWGDWREGSTWYRSHHPEYEFPNQQIALTREFADRNSGSILLEAEGCDEYYTTEKGNAGGAYRLDWYNDIYSDKEFWDLNLEANISVFRPLHNLSDIQRQFAGNDKNRMAKIATGLKDVWAIGTDTKVYCNEVDGYPVRAWRSAVQLQLAKDISIGSISVWVINSVGNLMRTSLSNNKDCNESTGWENKQTDIKIIDIEATQSMLWGVDENNKVYYRDLGGYRPWVRVPGKLTAITADESFVWGFSPEGEIVMMSAQSHKEWKKIDNPHKLTKLSAGNYEVWGINAENKVYRMSSSGFGEWEYVNEGFAEVSVGIDYVWMIDTSGVTYKYEMSGFQDKAMFELNAVSGIEEEKVDDSKLAIRQNPFIDNIEFEFNAYENGLVTTSIYNINGQLVRNRKQDIQLGKNTVKIENLEDLKSGVYILSVDGAGIKHNTKVIKID